MKSSTQAYLCVFAIVALIAFLLSGVFANIVVIDNSNSTKIIAIENDSFEPHQIDNVEIIVPKVVVNNTTHVTNNTTTHGNTSSHVIEVTDNTGNYRGGQIV